MRHNFLMLVMLFVMGCSGNTDKLGEIAVYPLDDLSGLINPAGLQIDTKYTTDGAGSIRFTVSDSTVVSFFNSGDIDAEDCKLVYSARVRTENVDGDVYIEMWCHFKELGYYFSRSLKTKLTGTTNWTTLETPFYLHKGENPDNVLMNIVSTGTGTVWVDEMKLTTTELK